MKLEEIKAREKAARHNLEMYRDANAEAIKEDK